MNMQGNQQAMTLLNRITGDEATTDKSIVASSNEQYPLYGYIVAYTLGEARIPHNKAKLVWDARGIPVSPATHIDALKRAITRYAQTEHSYRDEDGSVRTGVFRIRDKGVESHKDDKVDIYIWELSYHETTSARQVQHHESLLQMEVYKKGKGIDPTDIAVHFLDNSASDGIKVRAEQVTQVIIKEYESLITHISNDQIRDTVMRAIKQHDGVPFVVGRGGAWFVPLKSREFVISVKNAIKDTRAYARNSVDVRIIPVMKDDDIKASIAEDVAEHVKTDYEALLRTVLRRVQSATSDESREAVLQDAISKKATLMGLRDRYEELLSTTIELKLEPEQPRTALSGRVAALMDELREVD
jgi:hypothetical protein